MKRGLFRPGAVALALIVALAQATGEAAGAAPVVAIEESGEASGAGPTATVVDPARAKGVVDREGLAPYVPPKRNFGFAAGEVILLEVLPWSVNRYLSKSQFAYISVATVRQNLETGFTYDRDSFKTDQSSHPFHGSLFFNAARSNGYSFWESGAFAFLGSFAWETGMESEPPAINDLVNTTLGGMDRGEIAHRLSMLLRDNTARGSSRFWRELGAAVINPVGAFNRLLNGELNGKFANPPDRFPTRFVVDLEGQYRDRTSALSGDASSAQGALEARLRYGDPFDGEKHRPYEWFDLTMDLAYPSTAFISRVESRGVVADGPLESRGDAQQRLALLLHFTYYDDGPISFGAQSFDLKHLLLLPLGKGAELRTEAGIAFAPLAALQVDYQRLSTAVYGRTFDYGPAGLADVSARIRRREIDLVKVGYGVLWQSTLDGIGKHSRIQSVSAEARVPFFGDRLSAGAGWGWSERMTTYDLFPTVKKSGSAVKLFAAVNFH